ncbi:MAG: DUF3857 and transglutaminase domain-containing protein [Polyangiaceae bacterium]
MLRDLNVTTVFENGLSSQFHQVVFQPLTDGAAAQDRQYAFGYEADRQVVQLRGAKVYRKNGKVDEAIEWGEGPADDPSIAMYTSARTFYVQLPRLEASDVVELRYRIDDVTPRNQFADYFGDVEYMGGRDPTANAEYVLITPNSRKMLVDAHVPGLEQTTQAGERSTIHRFYAKQVNRLQIEPAMPQLPEVLPFIHVSTYQNWKDLGRWYWGLVKDQFDLDDETRQLAHKIVKGKTTELEKVQAIYDWVTRNTRYVALEFGIYGYKPRRCVQTIARGWGDCKDKATVLATLLKEVGVPSTIVVLRTQMRGDFRSNFGELRALRSRHRLRAVARHVPGRHRRAHRRQRAPAHGPRRARPTREPGRLQAHSLARSGPEQELRAPQRARQARSERRSQARSRVHHRRLRLGRVAPTLPRRLHAP